MLNPIVIIPTYNEKENIENIIRKIFSLSQVFEILVIDDNSPDGTAAIVKNLIKEYSSNLHIIERSGKLGLGTAYITGFKWCLENGYNFIFEMDADFSHNPDDLINLFNVCSIEKPALIIGSRYKTGVNVVNWSMGRVIMSYYASAYVRFITGMSIRDTTAGFVCYHRKVLDSINLESIKMKGYGFQIEMKFTVWKLGFNIVEVPIIFTDRKQGTSKMSGGIFNEAVWGVLKMKLYSLFYKYKVLTENEIKNEK